MSMSTPSRPNYEDMVVLARLARASMFRGCYVAIDCERREEKRSHERLTEMGLVQRADSEALELTADGWIVVDRMMVQIAPPVLEANPARLRDGTWGAWVKGEVEVDTPITITTRSGKTLEKVVHSIEWQGRRGGDYLTLVRTEPGPEDVVDVDVDVDGANDYNQWDHPPDDEDLPF